MNGKTKIITIAAVSGGGKTTITERLARELKNSKALYFDSYKFNNCPADICKWIDDGADYDEWVLTPLITDIQQLRQNSNIDYIIVDYPFAYLNSSMRDLIDVTIYVDTPLDIAMARRIIRDFKDEPIIELHKDLNHYITHARKAYVEASNTVKPNSDIVLDGSLSVSEIIDRIVEELNRREVIVNG
ncbi:MULTISPECIES: AAA family ATPase [Bacillus]|uniref:AAA family ATPase n=1 Tax=Bacillus TaxID=1386 RepID=UPI0004693D2C|nr:MULTISPECIES: AAA family ATPase [Bacillus]MED1411205.1 AAA family ATPase [Bacillus paramycoides]MED1466445.1 AAA family ATPase [Bacillus paramycoides]MED1495648.1 AAA family ATPase [Bacillus paramycoides]